MAGIAKSLRQGKRREGKKRVGERLLRQEVIQLATDLQCLQLHESADRLVSNEDLGYGLLA